MSWQERPLQSGVSWLQELMSGVARFIDEEIPGGPWSVFGLCIVSYFSFRFITSSYYVSKTKQRILSRQVQSKKRFEALRRRLEGCKEIDLSITELSFRELQSKLQKGDLTAIKVLLSFQWKALQVNDELNCITDFVDGAEARAAELDKLSPSERGPLHGIPVSLKEVVGVAGHDSTAGMSHFIDEVYADDGVLLKVLIHQGAVPFAMTNLSQVQMSIACSNPIFGETKNPKDHSRTCGGSSGGEGALLSAGASVMGVACDMGGSIRIPSHFCGVCGMKPTPNRLSIAGNFPFGQGILTFAEVYGPMGRDVDTLVAMMKAALCQEMWSLDPLIPQLPWRDEMYTSTKPLKIGFYVNDGGLEPVPAVRRCVLHAKKTLESMGHTVVDFQPTGVVPALGELFFAGVMGDNGQMMEEYMKHDVVDPSIRYLFLMFKIPAKIRRAIVKLCYFMHPVEKAILCIDPPRTVFRWWQLNERVEEFKRSFMEKMKSQGLEAILCPVLPFPAFPTNNESNATAGATYTSLFNILDLPAGVVPVGKVEKADLEAMKDYPRRTTAEKYVHEISKGSEGLPIGVQCVSLPFHEEVTLRLMKDLEKGLNL